MKTAPPCTLVQYMNTHIARWKLKTELVQKAIDALPDSHDHTDEVHAEEKRSRTLSDNFSQGDEEKKDDEIHWSDQEPMNMSDHAMITEKTVA